MISVLILTKNEQQDLPGCLKSVSWSDDIHVFDSYSEDKTVEIAKKTGAKVTQRIFDGYASQRNAALNGLKYKYSWVLILDADECIPDALVPILKKKITESNDAVNGFRLRRRDYLGKKWLKYAQISPFYIRLIRAGKVHYDREVNEVLHVQGRVENINGYFNHFPFSKGISHWLKKHNQYSSMEAQRCIEEYNSAMRFSFKKALFSKDFSERRFHQKGLFYKMPGRPLMKWLYMVIWRKGFLDGKAGFMYATLQAIYEYFIILKTRELLAENRNKNH